MKLSISILGFIVLMMNCNKSKMSGGSSPAGNQIIKTPGIDENTNGGDKQLANGESLTILIQTAGDKTQNADVDIVFALDITGSMTAVIETIKTGISSVAAYLKNAGINPQFGLVKFVDATPEIDSSAIPLTTLESFQQQIKPIAVVNNGDYPEAALYALIKALSLLNNSTRALATKILFLITDVVGHNGAPQENPYTGAEPLSSTIVRDCNIQSLVGAINGFSKGPLKFAYSVPGPEKYIQGTTTEAGAAYDCQSRTLNKNGLTASKQMTDITAAIGAKGFGALKDQAGAPIWPINNSNFQNDFSRMIQSTVTNVCYAEKAQLKNNSGNEVSSWTLNKKDLPALYRDGNELKAAENVEFKNLTVPGKATLLVSRCCVSKTDFTAGSYDNCVLRYTQTITYNLQAK